MLMHNQRCLAFAAACLAVPLVFPSAASAQKLTTLYSFTGGSDGFDPVGALLLSGKTLFGETSQGGSLGDGALFKLAPVKGKKTYAETTIAGIAGSAPTGGLAVGPGVAYFVSQTGGAAGEGALFSVNLTTGAEADLHDFSGADGANPAGAVVRSGSFLYGTTSGSNTVPGTLFKFDLTTGALTTLHIFNTAADAASPKGALVLESNVLYGASQRGGTYSLGTIFSYNLKSKTEAVLYSFTGGLDGSFPVGGLAYAGGLLYGTAVFGGSGFNGTVFSVNATTGAETTLYAFTGGNDGGFPLNGVIFESGVLYGDTLTGGASALGAVFSINLATSKQTTLYSFTGGTDGGYPTDAGLTYAAGTLYGVTLIGGADGGGNVFALTTAN